MSYPAAQNVTMSQRSGQSGAGAVEIDEGEIVKKVADLRSISVGLAQISSIMEEKFQSVMRPGPRPPEDNRPSNPHVSSSPMAEALREIYLQLLATEERLGRIISETDCSPQQNGG